MKVIENQQLYFSQLDGIRYLAVCSVFICHWITFPFPYLNFIPFGSGGVNLFFVLSGFLISRILFIGKENVGNSGIKKTLKNFYIRRTLRIFPIYYFLLLVLYSLNFENVRALFLWLFTYTLNIKFSFQNVWESKFLGAFDHLWSLSAEEQFYLLFPIAVFLFPFHRIKSLVYALILIGLGSRFIIFYFNFPINSIYVFPTTCFDSFGVGALLAYMYQYEKEKLLNVLNNKIYFFLSICFFIVLIVYSRIYIDGYKECRTVIERFSFSVICFWIVGWGVFNEYTGVYKRVLEMKIIVYLGRISYGLYIYHNFIGQIPMINRNRFFTSCLADNLTKACIYFSLTILISTISFFLLELPINKFKNKFN